MFSLFEMLLYSRGLHYLLGVFVVVFVLFATAARSPTPRCRRCKNVNRPMARYCSHCGNPLIKS